MSVSTELKKTFGDTRKMVIDTRRVLVDTRRVATEAKPLFAVAGASDLWIAKLRETGGRLQSARVDPAALQRRVGESLGGLQSGASALQHTVQAQLAMLPGAAVDVATRLVETYDDLAERGEKTVGRVRRRPGTVATQSAVSAPKPKAAGGRRKSSTRTRPKAAATAKRESSQPTTRAKAPKSAADKSAAAGRTTAAAAANSAG